MKKIKLVFCALMMVCVAGCTINARKDGIYYADYGEDAGIRYMFVRFEDNKEMRMLFSNSFKDYKGLDQKGRLYGYKVKEAGDTAFVRSLWIYNTQGQRVMHLRGFEFKPNEGGHEFISDAQQGNE